MLATIILAILIFGYTGYVIYKRFIKKGASSCQDCQEVGCPLVDPLAKGLVHFLGLKSVLIQFLVNFLPVLITK